MMESNCYQHSQATKGPNSCVDRETVRIDQYQLPLPVFVTNMPKAGGFGLAAVNSEQSTNRVMSPYNDEEVLNGIEAVIRTLEDSTEAVKEGQKGLSAVAVEGNGQLKQQHEELLAKLTSGVEVLVGYLVEIKNAIRSLPSAQSAPKKLAPAGWRGELTTFGQVEVLNLQVGFPVNLVRVTEDWGVPMVVYVDGKLAGVIPAGGGERKVAIEPEAEIKLCPAFAVEEHWADRQLFVELEG